MTEQPRRWGRPDPMADPPSPSRLWNLPNALTMLRLLLVPVFGYLLLVDSGQSERSRWLAAVVFVVASATDLADGAIARARNLVTTFGKATRPIVEPGLYTKWPWPVQKVTKLDKRMQTLEGKFEETLRKGGPPP